MNDITIEIKNGRKVFSIDLGKITAAQALTYIGKIVDQYYNEEINNVTKN